MSEKTTGISAPGPLPSGAPQIHAREEVGRELAKVPALRYKLTPEHIRVEPMDEDGFPVEVLALGGGGYSVHFGGWYERFPDEETALDWLFAGLSEDCRVQVVSHGDYPHRWTLQVREEEEWVPAGSTALLFFPFWKPAGVRYLQNRIIRRPGGEKMGEPPAGAGGDPE